MHWSGVNILGLHARWTGHWTILSLPRLPMPLRITCCVRGGIHRRTQHRGWTKVCRVLKALKNSGCFGMEMTQEPLTLLIQAWKVSAVSVTYALINSCYSSWVTMLCHWFVEHNLSFRNKFACLLLYFISSHPLSIPSYFMFHFILFYHIPFPSHPIPSHPIPSHFHLMPFSSHPIFISSHFHLILFPSHPISIPSYFHPILFPPHPIFISSHPVSNPSLFHPIPFPSHPISISSHFHPILFHVPSSFYSMPSYFHLVPCPCHPIWCPMMSIRISCPFFVLFHPILSPSHPIWCPICHLHMCTF